LLQDSPPDVWLQLLVRCAAAPSCQSTAVRSLAQQLAEHRALTAQQQQQLAEQRALTTQEQQQIAGLHQHLSAQQRHAAEQLAGLQGQISAQRQLVIQQGAQIAALQAQLQLLLQRQQQ
jgi:hypothetical protein